MIAGIYNLYCEKGTTFTRLLEIEYPDPVDPTTFFPFDLTGFSASMQVRRTVDSPTPLISLNSSNGGIEVQPGAVENALRVFMSANQTATITSDGVYDIEVEDVNGNVSRILKGTFTLSPQVTR